MIFETWKKFFTQSQFFRTRTSQLTAHCCIDRGLKGIRSNRQQTKRFRELPFEKGLRMLAFSIRRIYITINGLSRCIVPPPPPFTSNRIDDRFDGGEKIVCTTHPWRNISQRRVPERSFPIQNGLPLPSRTEEKGRGTSVNDLKERIKI